MIERMFNITNGRTSTQTSLSWFILKAR
uniref:Uncharacterized protein n=1 Tax=Lepeophtheirus salmonis TaxID=72036 RepID=A0A0K2T322_LEPSM